MLTRFFAPILALTLALAGCATPQLSAEQRSSLKRVAIGKVQLPEKPTIFGESAAGAFLLGGPIGLAIANSGSDVPTEFKKALERSQTDVAAIVREDLRAALVRSGIEVVPEGDPRADAVLAPTVLQYGLTGNIFSSPPVRVPALWVRVDLKKPQSGETIWWHWASVHVSEDIIARLDSRSIADYFTDPVLLNSQYRKASALVSQAALSKL
jgi:hypothetical protein